MMLSGWGRTPRIEANLCAPRSVEALAELVRANDTVIARGNGRAYGDSAINAGATLHMRHLNRMIEFDPETGQLQAEAGVLLGDIIAAFLPRGWFPLVTPGTKFVTLGGAIAADVHGKNHHRVGGFRCCVDWVDVMGPDGTVRRCGPDRDSALFDATLGGMGLTGIVLRVAIRLRRVGSGWIRQTSHAAADLTQAMAIFDAAQDAEYSVAWIDTLARGAARGRSVVMLGEHASGADLPGEQRAAPFLTPERRRRAVPVDVPAFCLNRHTIGAFNQLYYRAQCRKLGESIVDWDSYFYPLDAVLGWNRIYGRKGFVQFQCVLPLDRSEAGLTAILQETHRAGRGAFLAVLKRLGAQDGVFSFPMEGYTLAMDFPMSRGLEAMLQRLDQIVIEHGGRFYLAKDSRMRAETLHASDPRAGGFRDSRKEQGQAGRFASAQSERVNL